MTSEQFERFERKYCPEALTGCWLWTGGKINTGYGRISIDGRYRLAHRMSYEHFVEQIPDELVIDHICRNRACVNPSHLRVVTQRENLLCGTGQSAKNAAKVTCEFGHPFDEANTRYYPERRQRQCRECDKLRQRRYRAQRRLERGSCSRVSN